VQTDNKPRWRPSAKGEHSLHQPLTLIAAMKHTVPCLLLYVLRITILRVSLSVPVYQPPKCAEAALNWTVAPVAAPGASL
jgi:hypothetical protein